jgi:hypothetical protein
LFSQALNRYTYVYNNPLKFIDPTGQLPFIGAIAAVLQVSTSTLVTAVAIGAAIGAGMAALSGGNILKGALVGAIGGMFGVGGCPVMAMAGGALGALVTGGDPMMGAASAGIAAGISASVAACFKDLPVTCVFESIENEYLRELTYTTACGALAGGVTAEMFGGDFAQGAAYGAASAAAGYVLGRALQTQVEGPKKSITKALGVEKAKLVALVHSIGEIETEIVGGVEVTTIDGVGQLDDEILNKILRPDTERINKWRRFPTPGQCKRLQGSEGDSAFYNSPVKRWSYKGKIYSTGDVNYILQGHAHKHMFRFNWVSKVVVRLWKLREYGHPPNAATEFWRRKGFVEYKYRKGWKGK